MFFFPPDFRSATFFLSVSLVQRFFFNPFNFGAWFNVKHSLWRSVNVNPFPVALDLTSTIHFELGLNIPVYVKKSRWTKTRSASYDGDATGQEP
jgi:hypothetical protein